MIEIGIIKDTPVNKIIDIRDKNQVIKAKYAIGKDDILKYTLMAEHYIEISFELNRNASFKRSDYIEWEGDKYTLRDDYQPEQINKRKYKYTLKFEAVEMFFQDMQYWYLCQGLKESELRMTGNPEYFLKYAVENANRYFKTTEFNIGTVEPTEIKDITFEVNTNTFNALTQIADVYGAEWYITGKTIHLLNKVSFGDEVDFETEVSILSMKREEGESTTRYTRILALGSTRNIPYDYRETTPNEAVDAVYPKRLRIPANKGDVIDAYPNMSPDEVVEGTVIFDEVYPRREGTIEAVGTIEYQDVNEDTGEVTKWNAYKIKDSGINFKKEYLLPGQELKLQFTSGDLNGRDFALIFHEKGFSSTDNSQFYEIVRTDEFGKLLPNDIMKPKAGDKYVLYGFNIALVSDQYVPAGELELYDVATTWQQKQLRDTGVYECPTAIGYFKDHQMDLAIGQKVRLIKDLGAGRNLIRNSNFSQSGVISPWANYQGSSSVVFDSEFGNVAKVKKTVGLATGGIHSYLVDARTSGNRYIATVWLKADAPSQIRVASEGNPEFGTTFSVTTEWKQYTIKGVWKTGVHNAFYIRSFTDAYFYVANAKYEEGEKATDWTPAPEDVNDLYRSSRIMGFEKKLNNKFDAIYTVGDNSTYSRFGKIEQQIKELQVAGIVYESTGGSGVYVIKQFDTTRPTDFNVYSAIASDAKYFNKQTGGTVQGDTTFAKNMQVQGTAIGDVFQNGTFTAGQFGSGFQIKRDANGQSYMEVDNLLVRRETVFNRLTIAEIKSVGGTILLSLASMILSKVEVKASTWKCFFDTADGTIPNDYAVGDQAICRKFTGKDIKYYWALVTAVGADYIELSRTDKDGSGVPAIGDEVVQLGNRNDVNRQYAIMLSAYGSAAPSINQYAGINSYDLTDKEVTAISPKGNKFTGSFTVSTNGTTAPVYKERDVFVNGTTYYLNDRVSYMGSYWVCVVNTTITAPSEGSSTWRKQTAGQSDIDKAVDNISVGGRNLIHNSNFYNGLVDWANYQATSIIEDDDRFGEIAKVLKIKANTLGGIHANSHTPKLISANKYIATVWLKADSASRIQVAQESGFSQTFDVTTEWQKYTINGIWNKGVYNAFYIRSYTDVYFYVANTKFEIGNKATDWTPAPEDAEEQIRISEEKAKQAQIDADKANKEIADIANDNKLTPNEKQIIAKDWGDIQKEYPSTISEANKFGVSTTAYTTAYTTLNTYITPLLVDLTITNDIVGTTFRSRFNNYRDEYVKLLNAISTKAKDLADKAQTTADNAQKEAEKVRTEYKADFIILDTKIASKVSQTDFNALGNRVSTAESQITQQAGKIESVVTKVDNMSIGSDNLITNSSFIDSVSPWSGQGNHSVVLDTEEKHLSTNSMKVIASSGGDWGGSSNRFLAQPGLNGQITISFYAKAASPVKMNMRIGIYTNGVSSNITTFDLSTSWKLYTTKSVWADSNAIVCWLESAGTIWFAKPMVVNGNTVPVWSQSSKDVELIANQAQTDANKAQQEADKAKQDAANAQNTASQAQSEASKANNSISDISSDNKLTPSEKKEIQREWHGILVEYPRNVAEASNYGISSTSYTTAYNNLSDYITPLLIDLSTTSDVVGGTMRARFRDYYNSRSALLNSIADKAKNLADNAQTSANDAQSTANLKNRTYYQDAVPIAPSGGHKVGDLWHKTSLVDSSGNINADTAKNIYQLQYRWDGTTWRQINWSVSKSKIEQTDESIGMIVGKTGINSVGAGSSLFSMIKQTEDKIVLEVSKVQVGGRNLYFGTRSFEREWDTVNVKDVVKEPFSLDTLCQSFSWLTSSTISSGIYQRYKGNSAAQPLVNGKEYIVTVYAKASENATLRINVEKANVSKTFNLTTEWQKLVLAFTSKNDAHTITFYGNYPNTTTRFYLAQPKLEEGNKATDWTPAPEDTQAGVDSAQTAASNAQTSANEANSLLSDISNDNKFTPSEKQDTKKEWDTIVSEYSKNVIQATNFGLSYTAYNTAYNALNTYITPLLADLTTTSNIVGSTFRSTFKAYYDARTDLLNAISTKAKEVADSKTTLNEVKAGLKIEADGIEVFGEKFTVNSLLIAKAIETSALTVGGNMTIAKNGTITIANGKIILNSDGSGQLASGNILFNVDGSGSIANNNIRWDKIGNLYVDGNITPSTTTKITTTDQETVKLLSFSTKIFRTKANSNVATGNTSIYLSTDNMDIKNGVELTIFINNKYTMGGSLITSPLLVFGDNDGKTTMRPATIKIEAGQYCSMRMTYIENVNPSPIASRKVFFVTGFVSSTI